MNDEEILSSHESALCLALSTYQRLGATSADEGGSGQAESKGSSGDEEGGALDEHFEQMLGEIGTKRKEIFAANAQRSEEMCKSHLVELVQKHLAVLMASSSDAEGGLGDFARDIRKGAGGLYEASLESGQGVGATVKDAFRCPGSVKWMAIARCALSGDASTGPAILGSIADRCLEFERNHASELSASKQRATKTAAEAKALGAKIEQQQKLFNGEREAMAGLFLFRLLVVTAYLAASGLLSSRTPNPPQPHRGRRGGRARGRAGKDQTR